MGFRPLTNLIDAVLDKTIAPGYSRLGYQARKHWWPADPPPGALAGKRVVVTGASSGLGAATAVGVARLGATVHLVGRTAERLESAADRIRREVTGAEVVIDPCDVSDLDAVRAFAADLSQRVESIHALVHNAGVMPAERTTTAQGHELTLATHVLGPFLLTELLRDKLAASDHARVVWVSSGGMYAKPFTHEVAWDLELEHGEYSGSAAYARTKRMQVIVSAMLSERLAGDGVYVHSMHPGWADTPGVQDSMPRFVKAAGPILRTAEQSADTIVWLTAAPGATECTGDFWHDRRTRPITYLPSQVEEARDRQRLWDFCCEATDVTPA